MVCHSFLELSTCLKFSQGQPSARPSTFPFLFSTFSPFSPENLPPLLALKPLTETSKQKKNTRAQRSLFRSLEKSVPADDPSEGKAGDFNDWLFDKNPFFHKGQSRSSEPDLLPFTQTFFDT